MQSNGEFNENDETRTKPNPVNDPDSEICYKLYEMCIATRRGWVSCDDCLRICLANQGEWPFDKCPIPRRRDRRRRKDNQ